MLQHEALLLGPQGCLSASERLFTIEPPAPGIYESAQAQVLLEDYWEHYNQSRPHGALGYLTPAEFAALKAQKGQGSDPVE
jgi:transposase InsO family protein